MFLDFFRTHDKRERIPLVRGQLFQKPDKLQPLKCSNVTSPVSKAKPSFLDVWPQVFASQISLSSSIQCGINLAFSGVLIPQLASDSRLKDDFTEVEASWIASLVLISQPIGSLLVGPAMDIFGRKKVCIFQNVPNILGWMITYFTVESLWPLYLARLLGGFGAGFSLVGLVYTAEISEVTYRTTLLSTNSVNVSLGVLITTVAGVFMDWHDCALLFGILALASLLLSLYLPESPHWLASFTNASQKAIKEIVLHLNRNPDVSKAEWLRVQKCIAKKRLQVGPGEDRRSWFKKFKETCYHFKERGSYLPFILLIVLFLLQQMSGTYIVIFYTVNIFQSIGESEDSVLNEYTATIAVGIMKFILSLLATGISKILGRRPILIISALGMAAAAGATSIFLEANNVSQISFSGSAVAAMEEPVFSPYLIMASILVYVSSAAIGIMVIPWTLVGELLPTKIRGFGSGLMLSYGAVLMFLVIKTFPFLGNAVTLPTVFMTYSIVSAVTALFIYLFLPETHEKSFSEIEDYFDSSG